MGSELRNVFPCELENRCVEPEDGGVERRKRVKRHDRLADHLGANPNLLELRLTFRGAEIAVSSMSGEGGSIDLLFIDRASRFLIVEVKVKQKELDKAVGKVCEAVCRDVSCRGRAPAFAVACPDILQARIAEFEEIGITCFSLPRYLLDTV